MGQFWIGRNTRNQDYIANITWDITNNQTLDAVAVGGHNDSFSSTYNLNGEYNPAAPLGTYEGWSNPKSHNSYYILNYHWQPTENFSAHLMAGEAKVESITNTPLDEVRAPYVSYTSPITRITTILGDTDTFTAYSPTHYGSRGFEADFDWWVGANKISRLLRMPLSEALR